MPIVPVNLSVDDKTYAAIQAGILELCGMAKDANTKRVAKHLPVVADVAKEGAVKALDYVKLHKNAFLIGGGVIVVAGVATSGISLVAVRKRRKLEKQFAKCLQEYLDAAKDGRLTVDIINALNQSIYELSKGKGSKPKNFKISAYQFSNLINCIFDYTIRLAEANNISIKSINKPKLSKKNTYEDLQYYLNLQKSIFEQVA
ncbi:MAG: hypothetical protein HDT42_00435 [Ruminococcaceae bacterium]|nr:hypothetical protein [Oscillospiraceae bacterium]